MHKVEGEESIPLGELLARGLKDTHGMIQRNNILISLALGFQRPLDVRAGGVLHHLDTPQGNFSGLLGGVIKYHTLIQLRIAEMA